MTGKANISNRTTAPVGLSFWAWWVLANTMAVALAMAAGELTGRPAPAVGGWIAVGVSVSLMQQLVLWRLVQMNNWLGASIAGWAIGVAIGRVSIGRGAVGWDMDWAIVGLSVGVMQWFILRRQVYQAGWWVLACAVGLVMGGALGGAFTMFEDWFMHKHLITIAESITESAGYIMAGAVGGAVNGAVTGAWLVWLLRSKSRQLPETASNDNK